MEKKKKRAVADFIVMNEKGLHTRPCTELVKCASSFRSHIKLCYRNYTVNAKSLLGILMLAAVKGARITVEAVGEDAEEVVNRILLLAQNKFNLNY